MGVGGRLGLMGFDGDLIGVVTERVEVGRCCLGDGGMIEIVEPVRPLRTKEVVFMVDAAVELHHEAGVWQLAGGFESTAIPD